MCTCVSWLIDISGILPVSHQLSIFSENKHCPWKANYAAWTNYPKGAQTALRVWARDQFNPQRRNGVYLSSLTLVVKYLTCLGQTDLRGIKPGHAGQEKGPYSVPIFLSMPIHEWMYCNIFTNTEVFLNFSVWPLKCDSASLSPPSFVWLVDTFDCVSMVIEDATHEEH